MAKCEGRNDMDFYNENNYNEENYCGTCGNCKHSHYVQDEHYGEGWYCDIWLSLEQYGNECEKWESER